MAVDASQVISAGEEFSGGMPDVSGQGAGSQPWCYYKRPDGWICMAGMWPTEEALRRRMGFTPLDQYGKFFLSSKLTPVYRNGVRVEVLVNWNPNNDPFRLLIAAGGAREFGAQQIVEMGWHRKPPAPGVTFPQLEAYQVTDITCPTCHKKFGDLRQGEYVIIDGTANLIRHETIMHSTVASQNSQARLTADAMAQLSGPIGDVLKIIVQQQEAQSQRQQRTDELLASLLAERSAKKDKP